MKEIPLTHGLVALVDDDQFDQLMQIPWSALRIGKYWYAGYRPWNGGARGCRLMHRTLMNAPSRLVVDHMNGDTLDNRLSNLRICTRQQNGFNRVKSAGMTSEFKGVSWYRRTNKWKAGICVNGEMRYLGYFLCEQDAARAYDVAALAAFGEFSRLNFPV